MESFILTHTFRAEIFCVRRLLVTEYSYLL